MAWSDLADADILTCLSERYGIRVRSAEPLDVGDPSSRILRVHAVNGDLFVKVRPVPPNEPGLRVPSVLADLGIDVAIAPLPTLEGSLSAELDGGHLVAYPHVDGASGGETGMMRNQWRQLGGALRRIHDLVPPPVLAEVMRREDFTPVDLPRVRAIDDRLHDDPHDPIIEGSADLWRERRDDVDRIVERIEQLAQLARTRSDERAICHADIHPWNVLLRGDGRIAIVDWDDAKLAPRERDLMMLGIFAEPADREAFGEGYGPFDADRVLIAYYQHERAVQDMAADADDVLRDGAPDDARREGLGAMRALFEPGAAVEVAMVTDDTLQAS